jgi:hypothetical protein
LASAATGGEQQQFSGDELAGDVVGRTVNVIQRIWRLPCDWLVRRRSSCTIVGDDAALNASLGHAMPDYT